MLGYPSCQKLGFETMVDPNSAVEMMLLSYSFLPLGELLQPPAFAFLMRFLLQHLSFFSALPVCDLQLPCALDHASFVVLLLFSSLLLLLLHLASLMPLLQRPFSFQLQPSDPLQLSCAPDRVSFVLLLVF